MFKHHPIHPALVHFPIAFLTAASLCDLATLIGFQSAWPPTFPLLGLGLSTALLAMIAGFIDLQKLQGNEPAEKTANLHMMFIGAAWCFYLTALLLRNDQMQIIPTPSLIPIGLSFAGLITLCLGGWQGGKLVYLHGANVRIPPKS